MKTIADLNALIPILIETLAANGHEIGNIWTGSSEDDREENWEYNNVCYEKDGWLIDISYRCIGEWPGDDGDYLTPKSIGYIKAKGEITEIAASHYDTITNEESDFNEDDLTELWLALDNALKSI